MKPVQFFELYLWAIVFGSQKTQHPYGLDPLLKLLWKNYTK